MSSKPQDLVIQALRDPQSMRAWAPSDFDLLLRQARTANLLGRIGVLVEDHGLADCLPAGLLGHLEGARLLLKTHREQVRRELFYIRQALAGLEVQIILLKGAAYVLAELPAARGRMFNDIDILVPKSRLAEVENALLQAGWATTHHSAYDQRYYREWMHELPPLVHIVRNTALDVHHGISPLTCRWPVPSEPLIAGAVALAGHDDMRGFAVFAPADMVLHSMVHLLLNEEFANGLRDLSDLDLLLRHFGANTSFWPQLLVRAEELGLQRALYHGLQCTKEVLLTPIPDEVQQSIASWGPAVLPGLLLKASWRLALRSPHGSLGGVPTSIALFVLYLRAHWLRMPWPMLARHTFVKTFKLHLDRSAPGAVV